MCQLHLQVQGEVCGIIMSNEIKPEELRLLLIGKTGDGKSATANTILGREEFESDSCAESITKICQFGEGERYGRKLVVVDTPGLCDTAFPPEVIKRELIRSVGYASPGFHVIIFVLAPGRYTEECVRVRDQFFDWFRKDVCEHSLILITHGDDVKNRETYLKRVPKALDEFMESCGRRVLFFNNRASGPDSENQIKELIQKVDHIVNENEGRYFSNIAFRLARAYERMANTRVYQWMVKKGQAIGNNELTKRKTDQLQGSDDADHANLMAVRHDEVPATSSEIINASDEDLDEIAVSVLEEQMPIDETDHHIVTSHDTKPLRQRQHSPSTCDTNRLETKRLTKTSHDTEQLKDMTNDKSAQGPILRDLIKRPGMFEVFMRFFNELYKRLLKYFVL